MLVRVVVIGRTLTSAWIETFTGAVKTEQGDVALSRVRGLKLQMLETGIHRPQSHSHECVD